MKLRLKNRFTVAEDGWVQLAPMGEFPHGSGVVQVVDAEALEVLEMAFEGDVLLDFDHESGDPEKRTTAAGWIVEVEAREDGLWGRVRWSAAGEQALTGGEYRYVSPVWLVENLGGARVRPIRLVEAGLTNKPNLKGLRAISNRGQGAAGEKTGKGDGPDAATKEKRSMKLVNRALDLSPDASEEAALGGIEALKKEGAEARRELAEAQKALANRETELAGVKDKLAKVEEASVEAALDVAGLKDGERAAYKSLLVANRVSGQAALDALVAARKEAAEAKAKAAAPLTNRSTAKSPDGAEKKEFSAAEAKAAFRAQINKEEK